MATFYLDFEGGDDANAGTSFATRWKTIGSGATAARIAAGDTIRVMASPAPSNAGPALWRNYNARVDWVSPKNSPIHACDAVWTAAPNITAAINSTVRKQGTGCVQFTPAGAFVTGKVAHVNLAALAGGVPLDLSGFRQVSFWFRHGALVAAGQTELRLCSDIAGDVAVHTIPIPAGTAGQWRVVVHDNGEALSSSISSVAIYTAVDPGTTAFMIDNIVACLTPDDPACVTHAHVVGMDTAENPEWFSIMGIDAAGVILGGARAATPLGPWGFDGVTVTTTTFVQKGIDVSGIQDAALVTTQDAGSSLFPIHFSGGWDRAGMDTQNGQTYLNGMHHRDVGIIANKSWLAISGVGGFYFTDVVVRMQSCTGMNLSMLQAVGCTAGAFSESAILGGAERYSFTYVQGTTAPFVLSAGRTAPVKIFGRGVQYCQIAANVPAITIRAHQTLIIGKIGNSAGWGVYIDAEGAYAVREAKFVSNATGDVKIHLSSATLSLQDCDYSYGTALSTAGANARIIGTRIGGNPHNHRTSTKTFEIASSEVLRRTQTGIAWSADVLSFIIESEPIKFLLARVLCSAGAPTTLKCWMYRDGGTTHGRIFIPSGEIPGIGSAGLEARLPPGGATHEWVEVSMTFTPGVTGVVEVYAEVWGSGPNYVLFDDFSVT